MCTELLDTKFFAAARNKNNQPVSTCPALITRGPAALLGRRRRGSSRDGAWLVAALCSVLLYITVNKINEHIFSHYIQSRSQYIMAIISYLAHRLVPGQSLLLLLELAMLLWAFVKHLSTPSFFPAACSAAFRTGVVPCWWRGAARRAWGRYGRGGEAVLRVNFLRGVATDS